MTEDGGTLSMVKVEVARLQLPAASVALTSTRSSLSRWGQPAISAAEAL